MYTPLKTHWCIVYGQNENDYVVSVQTCFELDRGKRYESWLLDILSRKYSRRCRSGLNDDWGERGQRSKSYKTKVFRDGRWWMLRFVRVVGQVTGRLLARMKAENFGRGLPEAAGTLIRDEARYCRSVRCCSSLINERRRITRRNVFCASFLPVLAKTHGEPVWLSFGDHGPPSSARLYLQCTCRHGIFVAGRFRPYLWRSSIVGICVPRSDDGVLCAGERYALADGIKTRDFNGVCP